MNLIDLSKKIGLEPKRVSSTCGGEYASPCPACGGNDRFRMWPNQQANNCVGTYWCRQCSKSGDAIQFAIDFLGLTFKEALHKIGAKFLPEKQLSGCEKSFSTPYLIPPAEQWSQRAADFLQWACKQILHNYEILLSLEKRGLPIEAVKKYSLGYCERDLRVDPAEFCQKSDKKLFLPQGIVIPSIEASGKVVRIKIRRTKWIPQDDLPKYWALRGSMNGLNIIGDVNKPTIVVTESELDAYALDYKCSDFLCSVAIGSNTKNPDNVVDYWSKRRRLLICHDNDEGGIAMNEKWKRMYPHAQSYPVPLESGKDIGEAIKNGIDLRDWFLSSNLHRSK